MKFKKILSSCIFILIIIGLTLFSSCISNEPNKMLSNRTVIVYMIADNNLDSFSVQDLNEMEQGWDNSFDGNLLVYIDRATAAKPSQPIIYKIEHDTSAFISSKIIKVYQEQNSADPTIMSNVLNSLIKEYPAQSYGLVLWSHGSAWYPTGTEINKRKQSERKLFPITKSFGKDGSDEMNIKDLKNAIPICFDFIGFDACYMSSIEVLYELRNKANYIISSPTEVLSSGYPYQSVIPLLFQKVIDYKSVAKSYFNAYDSLSGFMKSASVSVIKTDKLKLLADNFHTLMSDSSKLKKINCSEIQQYTTSQDGYLYDLNDFVSNVSLNNNNYQDFNNTLNSIVEYKSTTNYFFETLPITNYSGISIFVPRDSNLKFYDFYKKYDWYTESGYCNYFDKFKFL